MEKVLAVSSHCTPALTSRVHVKGKFLYCGEAKLYIKGVTYGTFSPQASGTQYPDALVTAKDFSMMAHYGFNCVRTYTVPPAYLLDIALKYNIKVMVGLPWEQHITFLDEVQRRKDIIYCVQQGVASCKRHPSILCYAIGNEIPATIVRWYGKKKIENFLKQLYDKVKETDPESLVTYVNFPTTEYLDLSFLDFDCFNVYLETPEKLITYISRLHNLAGNRPLVLVLAEIGLDSKRNGQEVQANTLTWQIESVFSRGCAGMFVFAWTDEWWRGGYQIEDWDFGLVDRQRNSKPALKAVSQALKAIPFSTSKDLPFFSVVVCSFNGTATIRDTIEGLLQLNYPHYEVIVVNDGSKDNLVNIVTEYPVTLITTPNNGLGSARNTGLDVAKGDIVAYIDDDAYPDVHWLQYLAAAYLTSSHAGIGGPNIVPAEDEHIAYCVAHAPGGPAHVLLTDDIAEHIPGCNMSFRKKALLEVGGFNPVYRNAGDDVDICWRIQKAGYTIAYHPSAIVWHHRRNSIKAYWKQQVGYGKAEALLEAKWPEKYNILGHLAWSGRIYGNGFSLPINVKKGKVFYGTWGLALFQSVYEPADGFLMALPLMPEWYMFSGVLSVLGLIGFLWHPFLWIWVLFFLSIVVVIIQAVLNAWRNVALMPCQKQNIKYKILITYLHIVQPLARLYGRLKNGLTPWSKENRVPNTKFAFVLRPKIFTHWSEEWKAAEDWLQIIEQQLISVKTRVRKGGDFDRWDLQVRKSLFSISRCLLAIEEHGSGKQMLRLKIWPVLPRTFTYSVLVLTAISLLAAISNVPSVAIIIGVIVLLVAAEHIKDSASTMYTIYIAVKSLNATPSAKMCSVKDSSEKAHAGLTIQGMDSMHAEAK